MWFIAVIFFFLLSHSLLQKLNQESHLAYRYYCIILNMPDMEFFTVSINLTETELGFRTLNSLCHILSLYNTTHLKVKIKYEWPNLNHFIIFVIFTKRRKTGHKVLVILSVKIIRSPYSSWQRDNSSSYTKLWSQIM